MGCGVEAEAAGGVAQLSDDSSKLRLQPARLRGSELRRDDEGLKTVQRLVDSLQTSLAVGGDGRAGRTHVRLGSQQAEGVVQERAPFGRVGLAVGAQEGESLRELQSVMLDRAEKRLLLAP